MKWMDLSDMDMNRKSRQKKPISEYTFECTLQDYLCVKIGKVNTHTQKLANKTSQLLVIWCKDAAQPKYSHLN